MSVPTTRRSLASLLLGSITDAAADGPKKTTCGFRHPEYGLDCAAEPAHDGPHIAVVMWKAGGHRGQPYPTDSTRSET